MFVLFSLLTLSLATASCKRSGETGNENGGTNTNTAAAANATSATPPFETKEPERYQALRVETAADGMETSSRQTFIARDGARRREDYETANGKVSYLERPDGAYVLLPEKKLYSELKPEAGDAISGRPVNVPPDFSPEKLLGAARPETRYEKLGAEDVNGRTAMKYRVTLMGRTGAGLEIKTESFIWIDETLGMPVKSETTSTDGAKATMELREIKETVDASLFDLPADYKKVEARELETQMPRAK